MLMILRVKLIFICVFCEVALLMPHHYLSVLRGCFINVTSQKPLLRLHRKGHHLNATTAKTAPAISISNPVFLIDTIF